MYSSFVNKLRIELQSCWLFFLEYHAREGVPDTHGEYRRVETSAAQVWADLDHRHRCSYWTVGTSSHCMCESSFLNMMLQKLFLKISQLMAKLCGKLKWLLVSGTRCTYTWYRHGRLVYCRRGPEKVEIFVVVSEIIGLPGRQSYFRTVSKL